MRSKKFWALLLITAFVLVSVAGCGGSSEPKKEEGPGVLKLGVIQPLTGAIAYGGQAAANGHILAAKDINAKGGITVGGKKYTIELILEDSKGVPKDSAAAATKLISKDNVPLIMGDFTSSSTFASAEIANREGVPIISPLSSAENLTTSGFTYFFRGRVTTHNNIGDAAQFWLDRGNYKKVAMLAINDDWGRGDTTLYPPLWKAAGAEVVAEEYFDNGQTDFYPVINKIVKAKPDMFFVTASTEPFALIVKQAREIAPDLPIITSGGIDPVKTLELAGGKVLEGVWFWSVDPPMTPEIAEFDKRYKEEFKVDAMSNAKSGYDVMMLVAKAFEAAGTVTDHKAIRDALSKTTYDGYQGHYNFNESGDSFLKMNFGIFRNNTFEINPKS